MLVGLTYDLRDEYLAAGYGDEETAEFDRPDTIVAIEQALVVLGHRTDRVGNVRQLVTRLAADERWDLVFNIAEGMFGLAREAQIPALLDAYQIPYTFSPPHVLALALDKDWTKTLLRAAGVPTPDSLRVSTPQEARAVSLPFPLFAKPVAEGTSKGIGPASWVKDARTLASVVDELLERFRQPVLVERYLPGRELSVGIIGTGEDARALGTLEVVLGGNAESGAYTYVNKEQCEQRVEYRVPKAALDPTIAEAERIALLAWRTLGCCDAGRVDLRCDDQGRPQFLEVNPLAGLHPEHSDLPILATMLGIPYVDLIAEIVRSAARRIPAAAPAPLELAVALPRS
ncbi:MAG: D-alanine--D-alanine ligase [Pirellulales bacterium]